MSPAFFARLLGRGMTRDEAFDHFAKSRLVGPAPEAEPEPPQHAETPRLVRAPHGLAREHEQPAQAGTRRHARTASLS
jgi:hypothetical protein